MTTGTVYFHPVDSGSRAVGAIQSDGAYELSRKTPGDGVEPGTYVVTVEATKLDLGGKEIEYGNEMAAAAHAKVVELVPSKYSSKGTSGIEKTVEAGSNEINLELE